MKINTSGRIAAMGRIRGAILRNKEGVEVGSGADKTHRPCVKCGSKESGVYDPKTKIKHCYTCVAADKTATDQGGSTPAQYGLPTGASELQDLIEYREMNFAIGNIFKAAYRLGKCDHSDRMRDLRKIKWFVERELDRG